MGQLTLGGGEVERPATHGQPLSEVQQEVLRVLRERGELRSVEVGVLFHRMRAKGCGVGRRTAAFEGGGMGCCPYAAADGNEVMKRLAERGLVERSGRRGVWVPVRLAGAL